jgi:hypothetical protein
MKKVYAFITSFTVIAALFSFSSFNSVSVSRLMVGQQVPVDLLAENKGKLVWINFWAAYDATSRNENVQFSSVIKRMEEKFLTEDQPFQSISISMDRFESVFEEVVKQDNLSFSQVVREAEGFQSKFAKGLKLNNRFGNFLLDAQGKLIAKDLTPDELEKMLSRY